MKSSILIQFRQLENVELKEQGMIQNRKGFGFSKVLNGFIRKIPAPSSGSRFLPDDEVIYTIDVLADNSKYTRRNG